MHNLHKCMQIPLLAGRPRTELLGDPLNSSCTWAGCYYHREEGTSRNMIILKARRGEGQRGKLSKLGEQVSSGAGAEASVAAPSWFAAALVPGILISSQLLNSFW